MFDDKILSKAKRTTSNIRSILYLVNGLKYRKTRWRERLDAWVAQVSARKQQWCGCESVCKYTSGNRMRQQQVVKLWEHVFAFSIFNVS